MEDTAENTLMGEREEGKPETKEPAGKIGPRQCFEVDVPRV